MNTFFYTKQTFSKVLEYNYNMLFSMSRDKDNKTKCFSLIVNLLLILSLQINAQDSTIIIKKDTFPFPKEVRNIKQVKYLETPEMKKIKDAVVKYRQSFNTLDTNSVSTGILLNKGFLFGEVVADFDSILKYPHNKYPIYTSEARWRVLYRNIRRSFIDSLKQPKADSLLFNPTYDTRLSNKHIPFAFLNFKTTRLDQNINKKQKQGVTSIKLKFKEINVFAAAPLQEDVYDANVEFVLDTGLFFTNKARRPVKINIDFSDGNGINSYHFKNRTINVTYSSLGEKAIKFEIISKFDTLTCYSSVNVEKLFANKPDESISTGVNSKTSSLKSATIDTTFTDPGGVALVRWGSAGKLYQPFIIIEGLQPERIGVMTDLGHYDNFWDQIHTYNYDVVHISFSNNTQSVFANAQVVENLLRQINTKKNNNGSYHQNILMGESMGGLIGRIALKDLEEQGYDHQTRMFIGFDTPFKGGNSPMGYQSLIYSLNYYATDVFDFDKGKLDHLIEVQSSTATRQMAMQYFVSYGDTYKPNDLPDDNYTILQTWFDTHGFPSNTRNVAVISGSKTGKSVIIPPTTLSEGDGLLDIHNGDDGYWDWFKFDINVWAAKSSGHATASQVHAQEWCQFCGFFGSWVDLANDSYSFDFSSRFWDNSNGGYQDFTSDIRKNIAGSSLVDTIYDWGRGNLCFVPTYSSLALTSQAGNYWYGGLAQHTPDWFIDNGFTPFKAIYAPDDNNYHARFSSTEQSQVWNLFLNNIFWDELMPVHYYIQNQTISKPIDISSAQDMYLGNNVDVSGRKSTPTGNVVVAANGNLRLKAGNKIVFKPGFKVVKGGRLHASIGSGTQLKSASFAPVYPVINKTGNYSFSVGPSFQNPAWELQGTGIKGVGNNFMADTTIAPGVYTLVCTLPGGGSATAILKIKSNEKQAIKTEIIAGSVMASSLKLINNPVIDNILLQVTLASPSDVSLALYNISGIEMLAVKAQRLETGSHLYTLPVAGLANGIYLLKAVAANKILNQKVVVTH